MAIRPPDFKSSGIRAERIIASGSSTNPRLLLIGSGATGDDGVVVNTNNLILAGTGSDTWLFISGSVGGNNRVTFGGDVYVSGSLIATIPAAGTNTQVQFNDSGAFGANAGLVYNKTSHTLTVGNLTVTGTLTSISSSQVKIVDPIIILGSGTISSNSNGGIAIASGSSTTGQALVWGRVVNDTWGAGKLDVQDGGITTLASMTLATIRAAKFEAGESQANFISSSIGSNLLIGALDQVLIMSGGGASSPNPVSFGDVSFFVSGSTTLGGRGALFGGNLTTSGTLRTPKLEISGSSNFISSSTISGLLIKGNNQIVVTTGDSGNPSPDPVTFADTNFFVSGSRGSKNTAIRGVSVFGGDVVVSGTLYGGSPLHVGSQIIALEGLVVTGTVNTTSGLSGSLTKLNDGTSYLIAGANITIVTGSNGAVTIASTSAGADSNATYLVVSTTGSLPNERMLVGGQGLLSRYGGAGGNFSLAINNSVVATVSGTTFTGAISAPALSITNNVSANTLTLTDSATVGSFVSASSLIIDNGATFGGGYGSSGVTITGAGGISANGAVVIDGNLTVNGSTTTVNTVNLTVKDPTIYFGSGSIGLNSNGGIALASGSSTIDQALVWGRIDNDTWGSGKLDVVNGTVSSFLGMTLAPIRASRLEVGGPTNVISTGAGSLILSGANVHISGSSINFVKDGTNVAFVGSSPDVSPLTGLFPNIDIAYNLGSPIRRWANIYTGDLHLRNERGDWTIAEEEEYLCVVNNKTGKRYRMLLQQLD